jgi:hypothetical protein
MTSRSERVGCFQATLKDLQAASWMSLEETMWLQVLFDPTLNDQVSKSLETLLSRSYPIWNDKTQSFCQVPLIFDAKTQLLRLPNSRPKIRLLGQHMNASRAVYALGHCLPVARTTLIRHRCDNPFCLEVDHLMEGDSLDNEADKEK